MVPVFKNVHSKGQIAAFNNGSNITMKVLRKRSHTTVYVAQFKENLVSLMALE